MEVKATRVQCLPAGDVRVSAAVTTLPSAVFPARWRRGLQRDRRPCARVQARNSRCLSLFPLIRISRTTARRVVGWASSWGPPNIDPVQVLVAMVFRCMECRSEWEVTLDQTVQVRLVKSIPPCRRVSPELHLVSPKLREGGSPPPTTVRTDTLETLALWAASEAHTLAPRVPSMRVLFLPLTVIAALTVGLAARPSQATANFWGEWVLRGGQACPSWDSISLGSAPRQRSRTTARSSEVVRVSPEPAREARFDLGGGESHNVYTVGGQRITRDSRVTSKGTSLLISTDTTTPDGKRWLSNILRWSLESDGTVNDPRHGDLRHRKLPQRADDADVQEETLY